MSAGLNPLPSSLLAPKHYALGADSATLLGLLQPPLHAVCVMLLCWAMTPYLQR